MNENISELVKKLEALIEESEQAFEEDENYDRVRSLGAEIAKTTEALSTLPPAEYEPFRAKLQNLTRRIADMQNNASAEREQLRNEILKIMKGSKGSRTYAAMRRRGKTGNWNK